MNISINTDTNTIILNTKNGEIKIDPFTVNCGAHRLELVLSTIRSIQEQEGEESEKLVPATLRDLSNEFKKNCICNLNQEARQIIWQGQERYKQATSMPAPLMTPMTYGKYVYIYKHPSEPRFGGIRAERAYSRFIEPSFEDLFGTEPRKSDVLYNLKYIGNMFLCLGSKAIRHSIWFEPAICILESRGVQIELGCLIKTGKVIEHVCDCTNFSANDISVFAGYMQDALRTEVVNIESVQVTDDVGSIYRMGGNFTSCMRSLGWDDKETGKNSYQIYHDLGAKVAYITVPVNEGQRLVARAILWDNVEVKWTKESVPANIKIMDTIYRDGSMEQAAMTKWARQNGYAYKVSEESYSCTTFTYGPDRINEDFNLGDAVYARVYRTDDKVWEHGMYHRVPWIDIFPYAGRFKNFLSSNKEEGGWSCLHSQSGKGGFLTHIIRCQFCENELTSTDEEEDWRERNGRWTCPTCYDTEWVICEGENCNEEGPADYFEQIEDEWYCPSCAEYLFVSCDTCGTRLNRNDEFTYYNNVGTPYCEECYYEKYSYCAHCDEETYRDDLVYIDDQTGDVCRWCAEEYYRECDNCGNMIERDEVQSCYITANHEGKIYTGRENLCESCSEEINTQECPECGDLWDNMFPESVALGKPMCRDCFLELFRMCDLADCWCKREEAQRNMSCEECRKAMHDMSE